jgi:thiamine biosynthesis lipoprotein
MSFKQPDGPALQRCSLNGETMGTRYTAVFYSAEGADLTAIGATLLTSVDQVDRQMSTWNPASDLCRLNAAPEDVWIAVPAELAQVLETGVQVGQDSHGAFDIGMGELVEQWGFGPAQRVPGSLPRTLHALSCRPTHATLDVDRVRQRVRKRAPIAIDLSGIAKGFGVDQLAHCLDGWGIANYLVGIDGEMRACGGKPGGDAWTVAIEKPSFGIREVSGVMALQDTAIASSGDYRRWIELDGKHYAHTMHPGLRQPLANRLAAVTVLAPSCMLADAWATALLVLGETDGPRVAREQRIDALFVLRDRERLQEVLVLGGRVCDAQ